MTEEQLRQAKVLDETEILNSKIVILDMRSVGIINIFPQFAVYEIKGESYYFIAGSADKYEAYRRYKRKLEECKQKQNTKI